MGAGRARAAAAQLSAEETGGGSGRASAKRWNRPTPRPGCSNLRGGSQVAAAAVVNLAVALVAKVLAIVVMAVAMAAEGGGWGRKGRKGR